MSVGSISQVPPLPCGAATSGIAPTSMLSCPDVSTKPPSPDSPPPRASMVAPPSMTAERSATMKIDPPSPSSPALAVVTLSAPIRTFADACIVTTPPAPVAPSALIEPVWTMSEACIWTLPPISPDALMTPVFWTVPCASPSAGSSAAGFSPEATSPPAVSLASCGVPPITMLIVEPSGSRTSSMLSPAPAARITSPALIDPALSTTEPIR